jgi:glycosyltransferase involved in cell wall biosynthesis
VPKQRKISVVIPVYNEEAYIQDCLNTLVRQTRPFDEIIVVDNNSQDKTIELVSTYPGITVVRESNQGHQYAQKRGFSSANGSWIVRIDADTRLAENWCEILDALIHTHRNTQAFTGRGTFYDVPFPALFGRLQIMMYQYFQYPAAGGWTLWGSVMAIERTAWVDAEKFCHDTTAVDEDIDMTLALRKLGYRVLYTPMLNAAVSLRRGQTNIGSVVAYVRSWQQNYRYHGKNFAAGYIFLLTCIVVIFAGLAWLPIIIYQRLRMGCATGRC